MREFEELEECFQEIQAHLSGEESRRLGTAVRYAREASAHLETKYLDALRDRAIVHSLLEKTSADLFRRYKAIFEYSGTAMAVLERDGTITLANSYFVHLVGYPREEIEGHHSFSRYADAGLISLVGMFLKPAGDNPPDYQDYGEGHITARDGRLANIVIRIGRFPGSGQCVLSIIDITERKRAEDALRLVNRKLNLLSGITRHDIKNQLLVLNGFLEISKKYAGDAAKMSEFIEKEMKIAKTMDRQIAFTKEYEAIGVNTPVWQDCHILFETASNQVPPGKIMVKNDFPAGVEIFADPLIVKVFYNLLDNAVRYGGKITTTRFFAKEDTGAHILVCEDDGDGVPAEEKEQIFERGFGKNTGMGLFLAREILSITGITIRETGEPGKGARFEIRVLKGMYRISEPAAPQSQTE